MNAERTSISDRLLDLDPESTAGRQQLDQRVKGLFDRKLTASDWFWMLVMGIGGLAGATVCGLLAATEPAGMPVGTRVILAVLTLVGLFWATFSATVIRRRSINSAVHGAIAAKMGFIFSLGATVLLGLSSLAGVGGNPAIGLVLLPMVTLVLAIVVVIGREIRQAELRLQQRLLEIEYRLARMAAVAETGEADVIRSKN